MKPEIREGGRGADSVHPAGGREFAVLLVCWLTRGPAWSPTPDHRELEIPRRIMLLA